MKLKYNFIVNEVAGEYVAVAVGDDLNKFGGFIKMNDVATYIFKMLMSETDEDTIVAAMVKDFPDTSETEIRETVIEFVGKLKDAEVLL